MILNFFSQTQSSKEINFLISLSKKVDIVQIPEELRKNDTIHIKNLRLKEDLPVSEEQIAEIKTAIKKCLDFAREKNYTKIHIFSASRTSQSFAIGSCIQKYDVDCFVYQFRDNKYIFSVDLKKEKL